MVGADVFISYQRRDADAAGRLSDWLGEHFGPDRIFIDTSGLRGGDDFPVVITEAIAHCKAVVMVATPGWTRELANPADWVRRELSEAIIAGRPIVPVLLHGAMPAERSDLPSELSSIADRQVIGVSDSDFRRDVARLIDSLERFGAEAAPQTVADDLPKSSRAQARDAWDVAASADRTRAAVVASLADLGIRVTDEGDDLLLQGGNKRKTRLVGGYVVAESALPFLGVLRLRDRGASALVEVALVEDWGRGLFFGLAGRYQSYFDKVLANLRGATGVS